MTNPPNVHTLETKSLGKQDAQNGSTMSGFGRHLTDFLKYVNYEMPAEEAKTKRYYIDLLLFPIKINTSIFRKY
jgi:hypothetical protein